MVSTAIVALPTVDDAVYKYSSEKVPHLTLLFLGDQSENPMVVHMAEFIQHAARTLSPFGLTVDHRGTLGPDDADVLFFEKNSRWDIDGVKEFRANLLKDPIIKAAYNSVEQYPEWTPHLTMGYPDAPAKSDDRDYPGFHYIGFDRIALWVGDFEGPEFRLKHSDILMDGVVSMSAAKELGADFLAHYGKKGMRWGVTTNPDGSKTAKNPPTDPAIKPTKPGQFVKTTGGKRQPASQDAIDAALGRQKAKSSTTDALSNAELRKVVDRMNLEQQYQNLAYQNDRRSAGARFVAGLFGRSRYNGEKRKYKDSNEQAGERAAEIAAAVKEAMAESRKAKA